MNTATGTRCINGALVVDATCDQPEKDIFTQMGEWISQNLLLIGLLLLVGVIYFLYELNN